MAYTTPVLGATTLPRPSDYQETRGFRGGMAEMASGAVSFDVVQTSAKKLYTVTWRNVSDTDKTTIETAYDSMSTGSASFTPPTGAGATTVTRTEKEIQFVYSNAAADFRWTVSMELREI